MSPKLYIKCVHNTNMKQWVLHFKICSILTLPTMTTNIIRFQKLPLVKMRKQILRNEARATGDTVAVLPCLLLCCRVLSCAGVLVCCRVLVFWCHRYSNSTPAAPLLPFIFNLWHAVQLFELITSAAASVLRHHQWNIWLAFQLVALPTATSLLTSEKSTWHPMIHSRPVRVQRHQQSRNLKVCEYQQME